MKLVSKPLIKFIQKWTAFNISQFIIGCLLIIACIVLLSYAFSPSVIEGLSDNLYIQFYKMNSFNPIYIIPNNSSNIITNLFSTSMGNKDIYNLTLNNTNLNYKLTVNDSLNILFNPINMNTTIINCFRDLYNYVISNNNDNKISKMITDIIITYDSKTKSLYGTSKINFNYKFKDPITGNISNVGSTIYMDNNTIDQSILSAINPPHNYSTSIVTGILINYVYPEPKIQSSIVIYTNTNPTIGDQLILDIDLFSFITRVTEPFLSSPNNDININSVYYANSATVPLYSKNNDLSNNRFISGYIQDNSLNYPCIVQIPSDEDITNYLNAIAAAKASDEAKAKAAADKAIADAKAKTDAANAQAIAYVAAASAAASAEFSPPPASSAFDLESSGYNPNKENKILFCVIS
jgi:hypothetical protein